MKNNWKKVEQLIKSGVQPEDHISYQYLKNAKTPCWQALIRFSKLKKYNSKGWSKKISSSHYASMDAFYAASVAIRDSLARTLLNAEIDSSDGKTPNVPALSSLGIFFEGHTLDEIMGCKEEQNVDPVTGTPYITKLKDNEGNFIFDSFGNYVTAPVLHMSIIPDNDFDSVYTGMLKYTTMQALRYKYFNYIHPNYGNRTVESIQVDDIEKCLKDAGDRLSSHPLTHLKSLWKKIFIVARRKGYRTDDPTDLVMINNYRIVDHDAEKKRRTGTRKVRREVSDEEFIKILKIVSSNPDDLYNHRKSTVASQYMHQMVAHALIVMRYTGIRPAECFAIRKQDLILNKDKNNKIINAQLKIEHAAARGEHSIMYLHETKTPLSDNILPLNKDALNTLLDMIDKSDIRIVSDKTKEIFNERKTVKFNNLDFIFTDYNSNLCNPSRIGYKLNTWLKPYGIDYGMYTNRHQFASDMADQSTSVAQSLMRHTSSSMTMKYVEGNDNKMQKAVDSISNNFLLIIEK